ncbi:MAG: hypothetical protein H6739_14135 [Alphaproteobacteria bacterium]|nr:hypothetical protein [Alphaproteobacteria bacterium]
MTGLLAALTLLGCKDRDAPGDDSAPVVSPCEPATYALGLPSDTWVGPEVGPGGDVRYFASPGGDRIWGGSTMNGVFRSDDAGLSWTTIQPPRTHVLGPMAAIPGQPDTLIITSEEVWRTTDGGERWTVIEGLGGTNPEEGVRALLEHDGTVYAFLGGGDVYASTDEGQTFEWRGAAELSGPAPPHSEFGNAEWQWQAVATDDGTLYAMRHHRSLFRSTDEGRTWEEIWRRMIVAGSLAVNGDQLRIAEEDLVFAMGPDDSEPWEIAHTASPVVAIIPHPSGDFIIATDDRIHYLFDSTLQDIGDPLPHHVQGATLTPDGRLLVGHSEGIWEISPETNTWVDRSAGVVDRDLAVLLAHPSCPERVYVGTQCQRGFYESDAWGEDLAHMDTYMHYVMVARTNPRRPEEIWVTNDNTVLMTPNLGEVWRQVTDATLAWHVHGLALDPADPDHVLVGSVGSGIWADDGMHVYSSDDAGITWESVSEGLPDSQSSAHALHFVLDAPGVVLLGTFRGDDISHANGSGEGLFRSTDNGQTWAAVELGGRRDVPKIAECDGHLYAAADRSVMRSTDAGASWNEVTEGPDPFVALTCHGDTVIAFDLGRQLQRSDDGGDTWADYNEGIGPNPLGNQVLHDLAISADGAVVYLAVRGEGLYRRGL